MDANLKMATDDGPQGRQVLLPNHAKPQLDTAQLPLIELVQCHPRETQENYEPATIDTVLCRLLTTQMRDARISGTALKEVHRRVGWYLSVEYVASIVGVEATPIPHVQGGDTDGYRLLHEQQTAIVPLMRGREPVAFGVSEAFPPATFLHAKVPEDIKLHHLPDNGTVVLVGSVANNGQSIVEFVEAIRTLYRTIRIVVFAGVVHARFVSGDGLEQLGRHGYVSLVALRAHICPTPRV
jgi:uracil phosphoribosyltransferase